MKKKTSVVRGVAAGLASGLVSSLVMNLFQRGLSRLLGGKQESHGAQSQQTGTPQHGVGAYLQERNAESPKDNAAVRSANVASLALAGHRLTKKEKKLGGTLFHYAMGMTSGAVYGAAREVLPGVSVGSGLPFGAAVWVLADELAVPALGLSKAPSEYPASIHAYALASHLVYGATTDFLIKRLRHV